MTVYFAPERGVWRYDFWRGGERYSGICTDPETKQPVRNRKQALKVERTFIVAAERKAGLAKNGIRPDNFTLAHAAELHLATVDGRHRENVVGYVRELFGFLGAATSITGINKEDINRYVAWAKQQPARVWTGGSKRKATDPANARYWRPHHIGPTPPASPWEGMSWWDSTGEPAVMPQMIWRGGTWTRRGSGHLRTPMTINRYLDCLSACFTAAHEHIDPVTGEPSLPFPPKVKQLAEPKRKPTPLADDELDAIEAVVPPWVVDTAELARVFGLRRTEALSSTIHWIDRAELGIRLPPDVTKSGNEEFIPTDDAGMALLDRLEAQARDRGVLHLVTWPGPGGLARLEKAARGEKAKPVTWRSLKEIKRAWRTGKVNAGIPDDGRRRRVHDVRARFITEASRNTKSAPAIQNAARHADFDTTLGYIEVANEELRAAVASSTAGRERRGNLTVIKTGTQSHTGVPHGTRRKIKDTG